jgi:hypothetical protein
MRAPPRSLRRPLVLAGGLVAALAIAAPAMAADASTTVSADVNTVIAVSAPASIDFGSVNVGAQESANADVSVTSNISGGYTLSASRTSFTNGDIPLGWTAVTNPSNTTAATPGAIPTSGSIAIGAMTPGFVTSPTGDHWMVTLGLGPIPFTLDGAHSSTVTFTATATP